MALPTTFTNLEHNLFGVPVISGAADTSIDFVNLEWSGFGAVSIAENFAPPAPSGDIMFIPLI